MQLAVIAAIATAILGVAFAMQNNVPVTVTFLVWRFDSTLAMMLLIALALGAIVVALLSTPMTLKRQWQSSRQKQHIRDLEKTCETLRAKIGELERRHPPESDSQPEKPYVGLKQLIVGQQGSPNENDLKQG